METTDLRIIERISDTHMIPFISKNMNNMVKIILSQLPECLKYNNLVH